MTCFGRPALAVAVVLMLAPLPSEVGSATTGAAGADLEPVRGGKPACTPCAWAKPGRTCYAGAGSTPRRAAAARHTRRHRPRKRTIQYAEAFAMESKGCGGPDAAFAGHDGNMRSAVPRFEDARGRSCRTHKKKAPSRGFPLLIAATSYAADALELTPLRNATALSLVFAAFSSLRFVVSSRTTSSWPSCSAQAISVPYREIS